MGGDEMGGRNIVLSLFFRWELGHYSLLPVVRWSFWVSSFDILSAASHISFVNLWRAFPRLPREQPQ